MSSSNAIRAGGAFVEIFADDSRLQRTLTKNAAVLKKWGKSISTLGTKLVAAGTTALAPLLAATRAYASMGAEIARGSQKTGIAAESLSALKYASEQSGVEFQKFEAGIAHMNRTMVDAAQGSTQSQEAFAQLGLSVAQLSQMKPEDQFRAIAEALSKIKNPNLKSGLAQQIFGRSGTELLPLLNQGAAGIDKMMQRANELGLTMSGAAAAGAEAFDQKLNDLWQVAKMGVFQIGGALAPVLDTVIGNMTKGIGVVRDFVSQHQGLIVAIAGGAAGLLGAGIALKVIGAAFSIASAGAGLLSGAIGVVGTVLSVALSPIGLLTAAIIGGAGALMYFTDTGKVMRAYMSGVFGDLKDDSVTAFGGIRDALTAGDWGAAAQIMWTYLQLEFTRGALALKTIWIGFKAYFVGKFDDAISDAMAIYFDFCANIESKWLEVGKAVFDTWNDFTSSMANMFETGAGAVMKAMNKLHGVWDQLFGKGTFNVDLNNQIVDAVVNADKQQRGSSNNVSKTLSQAVLHQQLAKVEKDRQDAQRNLAQQRAGDQAGLSQEEKAKLKEYDDKINELKKQLNSGAQSAHAEAQQKKFDEPAFNKEGAQQGMNNMMKASVAGTFSAAGAFGLGGDNAGRQIAKNTEETMRGIHRIIQLAESEKQDRKLYKGGPLFGWG